MRRRGRGAVLIGASVMMLAVACGLRTSLFDGDDDSGNPAEDAATFERAAMLVIRCTVP